MTAISKTTSRAARLLLVGCSGLALSVPAFANDVIFSSSDGQPQTGQRTVQTSGVTQVALTGGGTVSIVEGGEYTLNADGSIDLYRGSITLAGHGGGEVIVRMPGDVTGRVDGSRSSGSFSVDANGDASGHALSGTVEVDRGRARSRVFTVGTMWQATGQSAPRRVFANAAVSQPSGGANPIGATNLVASISGDAGITNAAINGIPVTLGDGLAAAGASSDIIAAGRNLEVAASNPALETFPSGDFALLIAASAQLNGAYGGQPFNAAQADIIRSYLRFLASGASGADFLTAYSGFALNYLDLIRAGGVPSGFASGAANADDIDAYLAFIGRTGAFSQLAARDRALVDAYLAFLGSGQNRDLFAASFTGLTEAYFAFLRAGGVPTEFTNASQDALAASIAFLQQSGLLAQLNAADQALVAAFLDNGGIAFASQFQGELGDYFAFLAAGGLPSDYAALDQATLRAYLETLSNTGLLDTVLADQADFYADYLAFLRAGGDVDAFAGLPVNIFTGYVVDLQAYFDFLSAGGIPSAYTVLSQDVIQQYLAALQAAGATDRFLIDLAEFYRGYFIFVAGGGNPDNFSQLPVPPDFPAFAAALNGYAAFLFANGLPSDFDAEDLAQLRSFLTAIIQSGQVDALLGDNADLLTAYFAFISGGGSIDGFAGLPIYLDYVAALNLYFDFLNAGNLPSDYTVLDQATIEAYLAALDALQGGLGGFGDLNAFFIEYFAFISGGNDPDVFAGLPGNMGGGGTGGDQNPPSVDYAYRGGFTGGAGTRAYFGYGNTSVSTGGNSLELREDGTFITNGTFGLTSATATAVEISGDEFALIGRVVDGTYTTISEPFIASENSSFHYTLVGPPIGQIAQSGSINYTLLGATSPTYADGRTSPGSFEGALRIDFSNSGYRGEFSGVITMPDAIYDFESNLGSFAQTATFGLFQGGVTARSGTNCATTCRILANYALGGATVGERAGIGYFVEGAQFAINGAALFGAPGTFDTGDGGGTGGIAPDFTGTLTGQTTFVGNSGARGTGDAFYRNGALTGFSAPAPFVSVADASAATIIDTGSNEDMAWARWTNGPIRFNGGVQQTPATFSYHAVSGTATAALPTSGVINYELIGTTPLTVDGSTDTGTLSADMAIQLGAAPKVGVEVEATFGARTWTLATAGGVADPGQSSIDILEDPNLRFGASFNNFTGDTRLTGTGGACSDICSINLDGLLYGDNANSAALYVAIGDRANNVTTSLQGLALFQSNLSDGGDLPGSSYTGGFDAAAANSAAAYAYSIRAAGFTIPVQTLTPRLGGTNFGVTPNQHIVDGDGGLARIQGSNGATVIDRGTARNTDIAGDANLLIGRWTDGEIVDGGGGPNGRSTMTTNQGFHYYLARGLENPLSVADGLVSYKLAHATQPTLGSGRSAPGAFNANLAIRFGTAPTLGIDGTIVFSGDAGFTYSFATTGGAAAPSKEISFGEPSASGRGGFFSFMTDTGSTDTGLDGLLRAHGSLGSADGSSLAFAYSVDLVPRTGFQGESIAGAALFRAGNQISGSAASSGQTAMPSAFQQADWSRWTASGSGSAPSEAAAISAQISDLLPPSVAAQEGASPAALQDGARDTMMRQAERMMGGMITFGTDAVSPR